MSRPVLACLTCLIGLTLCPIAADAAMTVDSFATSRTEIQAGDHPSLIASFSLGQSGDTETAENVRLGTPTGFFLSPGATPSCGATDFGAFECPSSSQIGLITIRADYGGDPSHLLGTAPVYALSPGAGEIARLGFVIPTVKLPVEIPVTVRSGSDYGLDFTLADLPEAVPLAGAELTLWDTPADPSHASQRFAAGSTAAPAGCPVAADTSCIASPSPSNAPQVPLLHNPTTCPGSLSSRLDVNTYEQPSNVLTASASMAPNINCGHNAFDPLLFVDLTTAETRSASGLNLDLRVYDEGFFSPEGIAQAEIKSAAIALPDGLVIDSDAVGALGTCTEAQFATGPATACPPDSEVGTFSLTLLGIEPALAGTAYFGTPEPGGERRLFLTATGAGIDAKLVGLLQPGDAGGPVTLSLPNLPQLPLEELELKLAADAGLLVTPVRCGIYLTKGTFEPWSALNSSPFLVTSATQLTSTGPNAGPCPGPATAVGLSLSPPSITADGSSTTLATATVNDAGEIPVPGDHVIFSSTDPGQSIGAVTDNEDGTYTATITSSTTPGTATITATDATAGSGIFGTAALAQLAPGAPSSAKTSAPVLIVPGPLLVKVTKKPPAQTGDRTPTFRFSSSQPGSSLSCKLDGKPLRPCTSPRTLPKLTFGAHTFSVRATNPAGTGSKPVTWKFTVLRPHAS